MMKRIFLAILSLLYIAGVANAQCFSREYAETRLHLLNPEEVQAFYHYEDGRSYVNEGMYTAAIEEFRTALELDPVGEGISRAYACNVLLRDLAYSYRAIEDYDNALRIYNLHLQVEPGNWKIVHEIVQLLKETKDYRKAIKFLEDRIATNNGRPGRFRTELVGVYLDYQASKYDFEKKVMKGHEDGENLYLLDKAWEQYNIDIGEDEANVLKYLDGGSAPLGHYLDVFGQFDRAIEFYSLAFRVSTETMPEQDDLIAKIEKRLRQVQEEKNISQREGDKKRGKE